MLDDLVNELISRSTACCSSDRYLQRVQSDRNKAAKLIAAGVVLVHRDGFSHFASNPDRAIESVAELLSVRGILGWLFTLFGLTNPWMLLASVLIPILIDWFREREAAGVCGVGPELFREADEFLK